MKTVRLASVALADAAADSPTTWVEVTREGDYKGYPGGGFKFTPELLGQLVRNFRAHPSFKLGPSGEGVADVVPWDFGHASEMPSNQGSVPTLGAPAQAWAQDLQIRLGPSGVQLWAKVRWLEPARTYVKNGQYKWASVTVIFDARDPVTGANIGAVLTSIALTNTPFIEGMSELVAASRGGIEPRMVTKRVISVSVGNASPKLARAVLAGLAQRLGAPREPGEENEPLSEEEQAELARTRKELRAGRDDRLPMRFDASGSPGRNPTERAIACMRAQLPGFAKLSWEQQVNAAGEALRLGITRVEGSSL